MVNEIKVLSPKEIDLLLKKVAMSDHVSKLDKSLFKGKDLELVNRIISYFHQNKIYIRLTNKTESDAKEENYRNYKTIDCLVNQEMKSPFLDLGVEYVIPNGVQIRKNKTVINLFFSRSDLSSRFPKYSDDISLDNLLGISLDEKLDHLSRTQDLKSHVTEAISLFLDKRAYCPADEIPLKIFEVRFQSYLEKGPKNRRLTLWTTRDNINIIGAGETDGSDNYGFLMLYSFQTPVDKTKSLLEKVIKDSERRYYEKLHQPPRRSL